jgi:tetratricopeptide (TPR) repeat protein
MNLFLWLLIAAACLVGAFKMYRARSVENAEIFFSRGFCFMKDGKFEAALLAFDDARRFFGRNISDEWTARIITNKAHVLCSQGDFDAALAMYDEIIHRFDKDHSMQGWIISALYHKGSALEEQDKLDAAVTAYDEAISLFDPKTFVHSKEIRIGDSHAAIDVDMALMQKTAILVQQAKSDAAMLAYEEIKHNYGGYPETLAQLLIYRGSMLEQQGALDTALAMYEEVELRFGDSDYHKSVSEALSKKVAVLRQQGKLDAATALSEEIERRFGQSAIPTPPPSTESTEPQISAQEDEQRFQPCLSQANEAAISGGAIIHVAPNPPPEGECQDPSV